MAVTSQNGYPIDPARSLKTVPGTNVRLVVADGPVGVVLLYIATAFDREVESIDTAAGGTPDDWGYAHRTIAGSSTFSNHASATAIDLNALAHVQGRRGTFNGNRVAAIRRILSAAGGVVRWGGDYVGSSVDEMHFEINRPLPDVARVADKVGPWIADIPAPAPGLAPPTLRRGATGDWVRKLQDHMNRVYPAYAKLQVDGVFGAQTESVVHEFQRRANLVSDGVVGAATWHALGFSVR
jgi:hypothetical protein